MRSYPPRAVSILTACALMLCAVLPLCGCGGIDSIDSIMHDDQAMFGYIADGGKATITSYRGVSPDVNMPDSLYGNTITSIADRAFENNSVVVNVRLGQFVESIGTDAFKGCGSLKTVGTGNVKTIGAGAFENCSSLQSADLVSAVDIGERAFSGCSSLKTVTLGDSDVITVHSRAFAGCSSLETLAGGQSSKMESEAFADCSSLGSVTFSDKARLDGEVFVGCSMLDLAEFTGKELPQFYDKWVSAKPTFPEWTTIVCPESYVKAHRRYIYGDSDDSSRLFTTLIDGEGNGGDAVSINMDCPVDPSNGKECIDCVIKLPKSDSAAGWQFMNQAFDENGRAVAADGRYPDCGTDLSGAERLVFHARSSEGEKRISFFFGGAGWNTVPEGEEPPPYPDSTERIYHRFTVTDKWQRFSIDLSQTDCSYIQCGFGFSCIGENCGSSIELYLDDIYFEGDFSRSR